MRSLYRQKDAGTAFKPRITARRAHHRNYALASSSAAIAGPSRHFRL